MQNPLHRVKLSGRKPGASSDAAAEPRRSPASAGRRRVVGILGFGIDGKCVAEFLAKQPGVTEMRVFDDDVTRHSSLVSRRVTFQRATSDGIDGVSLLFRSPGFKLTHPLVLEARKKGVPITSSTTFFLQQFAGKTVGITGSNGKTTCTALIAAMLRAEFGKDRVEEGGNDRRPRLDLLFPGSNPSPNPNPYYAVLELSSFQLIDCPVSPHIAVVLNVTPNHLDWHTGMEEYIEAKRQIVAHPPSLRSAELRKGKSAPPQIAVLNERDPIVRTFADGLDNVGIHWFGSCQLPTANCSFKTHPATIRAAVTTARALGVSDTNIVKVLESFPGVPHRLEFVREVDRVRYYNDSSCTTPESAITACDAFPKGTVVLLLGGRDKGMDFSKLYEVIRKRKVRVISYGAMAETFKKHIPTPHSLSPTTSFEEVIATARNIARLGDNVILSPACASFDMFANAKKRGELFAILVRAL